MSNYITWSNSFDVFDDEYEIKNDGTIYGKADGGNRSVPLYKIATANFHNPRATLDVIEGIEKDMIQKGVNDINDLIGIVK